MLVVGDILLVDELIDKQERIMKKECCVVTDYTQGILELMPLSLFLNIYNDCYQKEYNQLYYFIDNEERYLKIGRMDKKIIKELFQKMNQLKGNHVFEYIMPK